MQKAKKMKLSDYEIHHTLGTGSFGRVKLSRNKITNKWVALKILKKAEIIRLKQVDHVINENTLLSNVDHPFIVNYLILTFIHSFFSENCLGSNGWLLSRRPLFIFDP